MKMKKTMMNKRYSELIQISEFQERFEYARLDGLVGQQTFGGHRYLNQILYSSDQWKKVRRKVIIRDDGYDLAHPDYQIGGNIYVHHLNPITIDDILEGNPSVFDLENLISVGFQTHNAIHYGDGSLLPKEPVTRKPYDTCPWR